MRKIEILDCTLRDGGYVNENNFGKSNIIDIKDSLVNVGIDYIECGYIMDDLKEYSIDKTEYKNFTDFKSKQKINDDNKNYTLMLLGEKYHINNLEESKGKNDIIRMSFHQKSIEKAMIKAQKIIDKGYKLFLQPTVTMNYEKEDLIKLLKKCNDIKPFAVAIVDTFGQMQPSDVKMLASIYDEYLNKDISIGFHAHNNLQNAFLNAITFINNTKRDIIIDSSICGMGRGAGNLPTELLINYLNVNYEKNYKLDSLLEVSDNIIEKIKSKHSWGYSLPYYLSAVNGVHPSYIIKFMEPKNLKAVDINNIIKMMNKEKYIEYDESYAKEIYNLFNERKYNDKETVTKLKQIFENKSVFLIGPGKSILDNKEKISSEIRNKENISISVNNVFDFKTDYIFFSNRKRYHKYHNQINNDQLLMITSNIKNDGEEYIFNYENYLSKEKIIEDNAIIILLNILKTLNVKQVILAGFDGFDLSGNENYFSDDVSNILSKKVKQDINSSIKKFIEKYKEEVKITSITKTIYLEVD